MSSSAVRVDDRRWPLLVIGLKSSTPKAFKGDLGVEKAELINAHMAKYLGRRRRFGMILDFSQTDGVDAQFRGTLADFEHSRQTEFNEYLVASALVIKSSVMRGMVTAYTWVAPVKYQLKTFEERGFAAAWVSKTLAELNIDVPG